MPGLSGYEVCEQIKAEPSLRHIPVLLLTGTFEAFDEARATAAGAAGHVAKPFEAQTLVDRVHQLLASAPAPEAATPRAAEAVPSAAPTAAQETPDPGATTDAFDFFSDDDGGTADGGALADGPLDLDEPDAAFAFGDDDIAATLAEPQAPPPHDATVAIMADAAEGPEAPEALDFSFGEASNALDAPMNPDDLGHTTLLDPAAGADLDVSSSDLAVDLSSGPGMATPRVEVPAPAVEPGVEADFGDDPFAPAEPVEADDASLDTTEPEPFEASAPVPPLPRDLVMDALSPPRVPAEDSLSRPFGAEPDAGDTIPGRDAGISMAPPPIEAEPFDAEPMDAGPLEAEPIDASEMEADLPMAEPISPEAIEPPPTPAFDSAFPS